MGNLKETQQTVCVSMAQEKEKQLAALLLMHDMSAGSLGASGTQGSSNLPYILRSLMVTPPGFDGSVVLPLACTA